MTHYIDSEGKSGKCGKDYDNNELDWKYCVPQPQSLQPLTMESIDTG
jgi:hypothetical protein